jgi:hypothetical protein
MTTLPDGREALDDLYRRDEILQALYWMQGEGLAEAASAADLARFLVADEAAVGEVLMRLAEEGYVERAGDNALFHSRALPFSYRLTPLGLDEGGRSFRDEFADYTRPAHGECGPGCWCKDPEHEGEACPNLEPERVRG